MNDWPPDPDGVDDEEWNPPDELIEQRQQDPFSAAVGDAWEQGRPGTILDGMP